MDEVLNPYAPGAGSPPPELAGRKEVLDRAEIALKRIQVGRAAQSPILVGLRGVGKTVLLVRIRETAEELGYLTVSIEAHEGKPLPQLLIPSIKKLLHRMTGIEKAKEAARTGLRVLKSFINAIKVTIGDFDYGLSIDPERGVADSGDIESDLPDVLVSVARAAKASERPIAIFIDELQYLSSNEFSALIMSMHQINQRSLPLIMIGAGLPQILGLAGNSKSYAERLFTFPNIGALAKDDAVAALQNPAKTEGAKFEAKAVDKILVATQSYPYFLQQWAYESWNIAETNTITENDVEAATILAIEELDESFFKVRLDRCAPAEKKYMRALAELGEGPHRSGEIADLLHVKVTSVAPTRNNLIKKGMVYSPSHGDTAFTVPLFDDYMRRQIPKMEK